MLKKKIKKTYLDDQMLDNLIKFRYDYLLFSKKNNKNYITNVTNINSNKYKYTKYINLYNVYIQKTLNNTIITVTNLLGITIFNTSCGIIGFSGAKRSSNNAYESLIYHFSKECKKKNLKLIQINYNSINLDKFLLYKILNKYKIKIFSIINSTPIVFNGCKFPRKRKL